MTPRKKGPRRKLFSNQGIKVLNEVTVTKNTTCGDIDPAGELVRCQDNELLCKLSDGRAYEVMSPTEECLSFSLRHQAESKFERLTAGKVGDGKGLADSYLADRDIIAGTIEQYRIEIDNSPTSERFQNRLGFDALREGKLAELVERPSGFLAGMQIGR
jgi:hypothetical protein